MNFIKLFNVEFDDRYDDVLRFRTKSEQSSFFQKKFVAEFSEDELSVIRDFERLKIYGNFNKLQTVNYAYFENEIDGVVRAYYAFVTRVEWVAIGVVAISLKIDVYQTYMFDFELLPSYVRRANVRRYLDNGEMNVRYLRTPENIDYGDEINLVESTRVQQYKTRTTPPYFPKAYLDQIRFVWFISTEPLSGFDKVSRYGYTIPAYIYMFPIFLNPPKDTFYIKSSTGVNFLSLEAMKNLLQDPKVITAFITREVPDTPSAAYIVGNDYITLTFSADKFVVDQSFPIGSFAYACLVPQMNVDAIITSGAAINFNEYISSLYDLKTYMYPYYYFTISADRGNEFVVKPQYLSPLNGYEIQVDYSLSMGVYAKLGYTVQGYLKYSPADGEIGNDWIRQGVNANLGEYPLMSDAYLNFLATQKASFTTGLVTQVVGGVASAAMQVASGNYMGAASSGLSLASGVANQMARIQDLKNTPDSVKKPGTDVLFEVISGYDGLFLNEWSVPESVRERLSDYFRLYGYTINDFITDMTTFLDSRVDFNFIQTNGARVTGSINMEHIRQLERIFDHGVRIWHCDPATWKGFDFTAPNGDYNGDPRYSA